MDDPNGDGDTADSIAGDTLVIFSSDNGGTSPSSNLPLRGAKGMHYEGGLRVPTIFRMPGAVPGGEVSDTLIHCVDFYPTILDFASEVYPDSDSHPLDGESLHAHVLDPDNVERKRSPIFYHFPEYLDNRAYESSMVIQEVGDKRYKYIYAYDPYYEPGGNGTVVGFDQHEFYNLTDDFTESINLLDYIDEENTSDPDDPSTSREYWDYIINLDAASTLVASLREWLEQDDATWEPLRVTYRDNFPGLDPSFIGTDVPLPSVDLLSVNVPFDVRFLIEEQSNLGSSSGNPTFRFRSEAGFTYQLEANSDLLDPEGWIDLGDPISP